MIDLGSVAGLHQLQHTLAAYCTRCNRWAVLPLAFMVAQGKGSPRSPFPVRCRYCGGARPATGAPAGADAR